MKTSSSRNEPLRGLAVSEMQDVAQKFSKWFPVASSRDSLRKFKPQGRREVASFAVTYHNFASCMHVGMAIEAVDLPTDAIIWPCVCLKDDEGDRMSSLSEAKLQETAWSTAMERFYVAGERPLFLTDAFDCRLNLCSAPNDETKPQLCPLLPQ